PEIIASVGFIEPPPTAASRTRCRISAIKFVQKSPILVHQQRTYFIVREFSKSPFSSSLSKAPTQIMILEEPGDRLRHGSRILYGHKQTSCAVKNGINGRGNSCADGRHATACGLQHVMAPAFMPAWLN